METWRTDRLAEAGVRAVFHQEAVSRSARGVLRGLHYQIERPQGKIVRCIAGEIFDVAVDLRRSSPSFGQWVAERLSAENRRGLWIPPGFAHGFYVLRDADILYTLTDVWAPEHERRIVWNDPALAIAWPLTAGETPTVSPKDAAGQAFADAETYD